MRIDQIKFDQKYRWSEKPDKMSEKKKDRTFRDQKITHEQYFLKGLNDMYNTSV